MTQAESVTEPFRGVKVDVGSNARSFFERTVPLLSKLQVLSVLILIFLGGNVKSHEAGLSVPDWPTSYGYNMFTFPYEYWVGGIWHEHVHRLFASGVGALTVLLGVGVWFYRRQYLTLAVVMVVAVIVQGLLGGLTVILKLPAWTSSAHGMLAQAFLCMSVAMAYLLHHRETAGWSRSQTVRTVAIGLLVALFIQLGFGAFVRHTEAGLAVLDFPTVAGSYLPSVSSGAVVKLNEMRVAANLPPIDANQVLIHLLHRYWAIVVIVGVLILRHRAVRSGDSTLGFYGNGLAILTVIQVALGISVVLTHRVILPTSLHVVVGASMMALTMLMLMRASWGRGESAST